MTRRALLAALLAPLVAHAAEPPTLSIAGRVDHSATYTLADLQAAPAQQVQAAREGGTATFTGTPLWPLVEAAHPITPDRNARVQHTLLARGRDGYTVVLALAELDPFFEGKPVLVAYAMDGQPLPAPRLVVPNDHHAARNVRDLGAIDVQ